MLEQAHCPNEAADHQLPIAAAFWIIRIVSAAECSSLTKCDADSLFYSLTRFECDGHKVHVLTQKGLLPQLTGTVKSLVTHAPSSLLSLAARLHGCHANHSHINNSWDFFWTDLIYIHPYPSIQIV